jgi:hypothetical protein
MSWNHTCDAGVNLLIVGAGFQNGSPSCTYNSVSATAVSATVQNPLNDRCVRQFYLLNPGTGSSLAVYVGTFGSGYAEGIAVSLKGVLASDPIGTPGSGSGTSSTPSATVPSYYGGIAFDMVAHKGDAGSRQLSATGGQTVIANPSSSYAIHAGGYLAGTGSNLTMSWSTSLSEAWAISGVCVKGQGGQQIIWVGFMDWWQKVINRLLNLPCLPPSEIWPYRKVFI